MNISPERLRYLASQAGKAERKKADEAVKAKEDQHVRLARITNGTHPDYQNGEPYKP